MTDQTDPGLESLQSIFPSTGRTAALEFGPGGSILGSRGTDVIPLADGTTTPLPPPRRFALDDTLFRGNPTLRDAAPLVLDQPEDEPDAALHSVPETAGITAPSVDPNRAAALPEIPAADAQAEPPPEAGMRTLADVAGSLSSVADIESILGGREPAPPAADAPASHVGAAAAKPIETDTPPAEPAAAPVPGADAAATREPPSPRPIEKIDLRGGVITTVGLSAQDVLDLSPASGTLLIHGDNRNIVEIGVGWTRLGARPGPYGEGGDFTAYTQSIGGRDVTLLIEDGITVAR